MLVIPFLQLSPYLLGLGVFDLFPNLQGGFGTFDRMCSVVEFVHLDAAGITLSMFVSDIFSKSGMHILRGLKARKSLEELIPGIPSNRIRKRARLLPESIPVQLNDTQVFLIGKALSTMDNIQKTIDEIDAILYARQKAKKKICRS